MKRWPTWGSVEAWIKYNEKGGYNECSLEDLYDYLSQFQPPAISDQDFQLVRVLLNNIKDGIATNGPEDAARRALNALERMKK